jgi:hypothetical protein
LAGGAAGSATADYGGTASAGFLGQAKAALRNLQLDVTSAALPLSSGQFDSASLIFGFPPNSSGSADYSLVSLLGTEAGSWPLEGLSTNRITTGATLTEVGGVQTLTVPVDTSMYFELLSPNDTTLTLKGQWVATRSSGEPPLLITIQISATGIVLRWPGSTAQPYTVQASGDLSDWQNAEGTTTVDGGTVTWTASIGGNNRFFRVVKNP